MCAAVVAGAAHAVHAFHGSQISSRRKSGSQAGGIVGCFDDCFDRTEHRALANFDQRLRQTNVSQVSRRLDRTLVIGTKFYAIFVPMWFIVMPSRACMLQK